MSVAESVVRSESRRPKDTKFKQQKMNAWRPIMTAATVIPTFIAIGIVFIPLGIALLVTSDGVQEQVVTYSADACRPTNRLFNSCDEYLQNHTGSSDAVCNCSVAFQLKRDFLGSVYVYYGLTNYYQNHRVYVSSRDNDQLLGMTRNDANSLSDSCQPYRGYYNASNPQDSGIPYAPCGAIANSMFNDTLHIVYENGTHNESLGLIATGIAWNSDVGGKFNNPSTFNGTLPPPYWTKPVDELDPTNPSNNGYENEDLIVWMRTAAFPNFRKFYRRVNQTGIFAQGLPAGNYSLIVSYAYPVSSYGGQKQMIITTTSWLGGKNPFLGIAYIVVGSVSVCCGFAFLLLHWKFGKRALDVVYSVNRHTQY